MAKNTGKSAAFDYLGIRLPRSLKRSANAARRRKKMKTASEWWREAGEEKLARERAA